MKILFLSQRVPYPPNRGDKITTWRLVERMQRDHEVRILAFAHDQADEDAAKELTKKGFEIATFAPRGKLATLPLVLTRTPLTLGVFGSRALQRKADEWIADSDVAYAYSSSMGAFLLPHANTPRVMHFAELDSDKWLQYAQNVGFPMRWVYKREYETLHAFEKEVAHAVDENVLCTPLEKSIFEERIPGPSAIVMRNGVDLAQYTPAYDKAEPGHIVFVGVMNYYPNIEGCQWFCDEILPAVRSRVPGARLSIVGSHPTPEVQRLAERDGVEVTGFVDEPRDWLERAAVSVAPLRIARGIQNKVLEAMAMGLPVVGTTSATQGVEGAPGRDFLVADDAPGQIDAVCDLLRDSTRARALGERARTFVEQHYDWEVCLKPLDQILAKLQRK